MKRRAQSLWVCLGTLLLLLAITPMARAEIIRPTRAQLEASPSYRYANMTGAEAIAELERRGVPFKHAEKVRGVRTPVRLTGPLHGVHIHSALPEAKRATTVFEILDARLALTLDDFALLLARHDIVEVVHYTMYRPNGPKPGTHAHAKSKGKGKGKAKPKGKGKAKPKDKAKKRKRAKGLGKGRKRTKARRRPKPKAKKQKSGAAKAKPKPRGKAKPKAKPKPKGKKAQRKPKRRTGSKRSAKRRAKGKAKPARPKRSKKASAARGRKNASKKKEPPLVKKTWAPPGTRHPAGLAIDVGSLRKRSGLWLNVTSHFEGKIGRRTCGANARSAKSARGRELQSIVCESMDLGLFTYILTPNFDRAHADHYHMEIKAGVDWFMVR